MSNNNVFWTSYRIFFDEILGDLKEFRAAVGHVLASPVFADLNGDAQEEMIVPVTYVFDRGMFAI